MKPFAIGQALKARVEFSGAFKLGAYTPQRVLQVLVKRGGLQPFPSLCLCLSALMTVTHGIITPSHPISGAFGETVGRAIGLFLFGPARHLLFTSLDFGF
jgi:hypothetical protein